MDTAGIRMQVLSVPGPGAEMISGPDGIAIAREYNDRMARLISGEPGRFAAFAHRPMRSPTAAADELERAERCGTGSPLPPRPVSVDGHPPGGVAVDGTDQGRVS
jgi:predicted TIM-barrel fold metal-dependent hydrolase